ncbi:hypothetical protein Hanom_Chr12g01121771 [Helianthus anomalus]
MLGLHFVNPFDVPSSHAYYVGTRDELKPRRTRLFHVQNSNRYHLYLALAIAFHNCSLSSSSFMVASYNINYRIIKHIGYELRYCHKHTAFLACTIIWF